MSIRPKLQIFLIGFAWSGLSALSFLYWESPVQGWIFGTLGFVLIVAAIASPTLTHAIHRGFTALAQAALTLITWILLGSSYYLVITPMGLLLRWTGSLQAPKRAAGGGSSYWIPRSERVSAKERYLRPF